MNFRIVEFISCVNPPACAGGFVLKHHILSATQVRDILLSTADHINGMSEVEHLNKVGHGKINAFKAIATLPV